MIYPPTMPGSAAAECGDDVDSV